MLQVNPLAQPATTPTKETPRQYRGRNQPLEVLAIPGALLRIETVKAVTGLGATTIYRRISDGSFPTPIRRGTRCTRWRSDDVRAWLAQQSNQAGA